MNAFPGQGKMDISEQNERAPATSRMEVDFHLSFAGNDCDHDNEENRGPDPEKFDAGKFLSHFVVVSVFNLSVGRFHRSP